MTAIKRLQAYLNNFFWLVFTYLLAPYFYFRIFLKKKIKNRDYKILVIQTAKIGDMVCSTPVFREIKNKFPSCHLTALINRKTVDILKNNPRIDEMILIDQYAGISGKINLLRKLRKENYDWAINLLPGSFNSIIAFWALIPDRVTTVYKGMGEIMGLLSVFNNRRLEYEKHTYLVGHYLNLLKFLSIKEFVEKKELFIKSEEEKKASDFLAQNNLSAADLLIGISPVPGNKIKQWDLSKFASLSDLLIEKLGAKIIFTGSPDDSAQIEKARKIMRNISVNASGFFKLYELPALLEKMKLFISVDSGPLYMANALDVPVVDIGGCYDVREQTPSGSKYKILQKNIDSSSLNYSTVVAPSSDCKKWFSQQLQEITTEEVFEAVKSLLN